MSPIANLLFNFKLCCHRIISDSDRLSNEMGLQNKRWKPWVYFYLPGLYELHYRLDLTCQLQVWLCSYFPILLLHSPSQGRWWRERWIWGSRGRPNRPTGRGWTDAPVAEARAAGRRSLAGAWVASGRAWCAPRTRPRKINRSKFCSDFVYKVI